MKKGIDLSHHNTVTDWQAVANKNDFVILRSSYGMTGTDNKFDQFVKGARGAKLPIKGIYHFSYALSVNDAVYEADRICAIAKKYNLLNVIIFYDHEKDSEEWYKRKKGVSIKTSLIKSMARAFCDRCISKGYRAGIYVNKSQLKEWADSLFSDRPIYVKWVADYTAKYTGAEFVQISDNAVISGIKGHCDADVWYDSSVKIDKPTLINLTAKTLLGVYGNGDDRKKYLKEYYEPVQKLINLIYSEVNKYEN